MRLPPLVQLSLNDTGTMFRLLVTTLALVVTVHGGECAAAPTPRWYLAAPPQPHSCASLQWAGAPVSDEGRMRKLVSGCCGGVDF